MPRADLGNSHPKVCLAGYRTIGYDHFSDLKQPPIMEAEVERYQANDLATALTTTLRFRPSLPTEPGGGSR